MKIVASLICGALFGAGALYAWMVWYFRDVMK